MNNYDRSKWIQEQLKENGRILIQDIASEFNTSLVTARKDLDCLAQKGLIKRIRGGAVSVSDHMFPQSNNSSISFEHHPLYKVRIQIAKQAAKNINEGDTIFLGSGMTCTLLARELAFFDNLTVVTNNVSAIQDLINSGKKVVIVGGEITTVDHLTYFSCFNNPDQQMDNIHVYKAFTSCTGFDKNAGITVDALASTYIYKCIPNITREWYMMVDYKKFDRIGIYPLSSFDPIDCVISNDLPDGYREIFRDHNIKLQLT